MSTEERIGTVTHYFDEPQVGAIDLEEVVELGDELHFSGHTTDFRQSISSMEVDHQPVEVAGPGDEVAVKVEQRVREGDEVYRVSSG